MPYVQRDQAWNIVGSYQALQVGYAEEFLPDTDPSVIAYLAPPLAPTPLSSWDVVTLKVAFNHENRLRALEGKQPITVAQFKSAVVALAG